jgi:hypothetical protein
VDCEYNLLITEAAKGTMQHWRERVQAWGCGTVIVCKTTLVAAGRAEDDQSSMPSRVVSSTSSQNWAWDRYTWDFCWLFASNGCVYQVLASTESTRSFGWWRPVLRFADSWCRGWGTSKMAACLCLDHGLPTRFFKICGIVQMRQDIMDQPSDASYSHIL